MVIEKNHLPLLRFSEFQEKWRFYSLSNLTSLITKGTTPKRFSDKGVHFVKIESLDGINIIKSKCLLIDKEINDNELKRSILKENDLLFAIAGATIGKLGIVSNSILPANTNQALAIIRLKESKSVFFILQILQSRVMKKYIEMNISVGAQPNLNLQQIGNFSFYAPQLPEQQKIAVFLTDVDTKIKKLKKKKDLLEKHKKGVMKKIFNQELRFKDDNGNAFPDWEEKKLGEISIITTGSSNRQDSGLDGEYTFFDRSEDIRTSSRYLFDGEAVIVAGEGSDFIPKYYVGKFDLHQRTYAIMEFKESNSKFIYFCIHFHRRYFLSQAVGSTVKSLRLPMFQKMPIDLPKIEEQTKIANFLTDIDLKIESLNTKIENSKNFKKGLLQKMFV